MVGLAADSVVYRFRSDFLVNPWDNVTGLDAGSNLLVSFVLPSSVFPVIRVSKCWSGVVLFLTSELVSESLGLLVVGGGG